MQNLSFIFKIIALIAIMYFSNTQLVKSQSLEDTIVVDEIKIGATRIKKYQAGVKVQEIDSKQLELLQDGNLCDLISRYTPLTLKGTAGGLSTVRFRGTSSDHTSINFGGINLNSLTLGHSNFSNIPIYLFDEVSLQYGSASAVNGTGSIGGAIHLGLKNYWVDGFKGELRVAHGSFGEQMYGTKLFVGNGNWEIVTRLYHYYKENNFRYFDPKDKDFTTGVVGKYKTQKNASIQKKGIIQQFNYKFNDNESFKIKIWAEDDWHNVQPLMSAPDTGVLQQETYEDQFIRIWGDYENQKKAVKYYIGAGYVSDKGIHNKSKDRIQTKRLLTNANIKQDISTNTSYKLGFKASRIYPEVYSYSEELKYEDRIDLFLSLSQKFFYDRLKLTANLRQGYVTNYKIPFIPAASFLFKILQNDLQSIELTGNIAKSYRVPTFNDRFWGNVGNPDLLPEEGMNYELGLIYKSQIRAPKVTLKVNTFFMDIDNWLLWKPGAIDWEPDNVLRVQSKGIEITANLNYSLGQFGITNGANYSLTNTTRVEADEDVSIGRQMEYVPLHAGLFFTTISRKRFSFSIDGKYTGERYTDENEPSFKNYLKPYFLLNTNIRYQIILNSKQALITSLMVNNILNESYQSQLNYAMPGINYRLSITYNFN